MRKAYVKSPLSENAAIKRLVAMVDPDFEPEIVPVRLDPGPRKHLYDQCYLVVREKSAREGGSMQLGWMIIETEIVYQAVHHAVWVPPGDEDALVDVTPKEHMKQDRILFAIDNRFEYMDRDIPSFRVNRTSESVVDDYIVFLKASEIVMAQGWYTSAMGFNLNEPLRSLFLKWRQLDLEYKKFISAYGKPRHQCLCGSSKTYSECHGRDAASFYAGELERVGLSLNWTPPMK